MSEFLCGNCKSSISRSAVRCPYCGVRLSGQRDLTAAEKTAIENRAKDNQEFLNNQMLEKQRNLETKRSIEQKKSMIDRLYSNLCNLDGKPAFLRKMILKSVFKKLIIIFLDDENEEVRARALGGINNSLLLSIDPEIPRAYLLSIQPKLLEILTNHNLGKDLLGTVIISLGKIGSDLAIDSILSTIDVNSRIDYGRAVCALIDSGHPKALDTVRAVLKTNSNPDVISRVISHIGFYGDSQWIEYINPHLMNPNPNVRAKAEYTLERLKDR